MTGEGKIRGMIKTLNGNQFESGDFVVFGDRWVKLNERLSLPVNRRVQKFVAEDRTGDRREINLTWTRTYTAWTKREI